MQIFQIIVLDRFLLQILEILVQDTFLQIFQIVVPDLLLQNFEIVVPDLKFCKLSKNSLGPKTKNGLIFEFFFAKEVAVLKRVCDRKEEQVEMIATFFFLLISLAYVDEMIRDDDGDICENCFSSSTSLDVLWSTWVVVQGSLEGPLSACMIIYIPPETI